MADTALLKRLATKLRATGESTAKDGEFWAKLAEVAAEEAARVVAVQQLAVPPDPFLAVTRHPEGHYRVIARTATIAGLSAPVMAYFDEGGSGDVWLIQIQRAYGVA